MKENANQIMDGQKNIEITMARIIKSLDEMPTLQADKDCLASTSFDLMAFEIRLKELKEEVFESSRLRNALQKQTELIKNIQKDINGNISDFENLLFVRESLDEIESLCDEKRFHEGSKLLFKVLHSQHSELFKKLDEDTFNLALRLEENLQHQITETCHRLLLKRKFDKLIDYNETCVFLNMNSIGLAIRSLCVANKASDTFDDYFRQFKKKLVDKKEEVFFIDPIRTIFDVAINVISSNSVGMREVFGKDSAALLINKVASEVVAPLKKLLELYAVRNDLDKISTAIKQNQKIELLAIDNNLNELSNFCQELSYFEKSILNFLKTVPSDLESLLKKDEIFPENISTFGFKNFFKGAVFPSSYENTKQDLIHDYVSFEKHYLLQSFSQAVSNASAKGKLLSPSANESSEKLYIFDKETIDDIFYILKKVAIRCMSIYNINGMCAIFNHISSLITDNLNKKLQYSWSACLMYPSQEEIRDILVGKKKDSAFFENIKNLSKFSSNLSFLISSVNEEANEINDVFNEKENIQLNSSVEDLKENQKHFEEIEQKGLNYLSTLIFSKINALVNVFLAHEFDTVYEKSMSDLDTDSSLVAPIITAFSPIYLVLEKNLPKYLNDKIIQSIAKITSKKIENRIFDLKCTQWGSLQLDRELRTLSSYFSKLSDQSIREMFQKILQISSLLQLETLSDIEEYKAYSTKVCLLTEEEVRKVEGMRKKF